MILQKNDEDEQAPYRNLSIYGRYVIIGLGETQLYQWFIGCRQAVFPQKFKIES